MLFRCLFRARYAVTGLPAKISNIPQTMYNVQNIHIRLRVYTVILQEETMMKIVSRQDCVKIRFIDVISCNSPSRMTVFVLASQLEKALLKEEGGVSPI
jgi:hypothetical protein